MFSARVRILRSLIVVLALVSAGLAPRPAVAQSQGGAQPQAGAQTQGGAEAPSSPQAPAPSPRPDLALGLRDLPPGYEEAPSLELELDDVPLHDRVLRQIRPGAGPAWVWTMTYQSDNPVTAERVSFLAEDLAVFFTRALSDVASISDWNERDASELGRLAKLYTFSFRVPGSDLVGDGALALFGPGNYLSYLAVLSVDGQSLSDLTMLARVVNARVDADQAVGAQRQ